MLKMNKNKFSIIAENVWLVIAIITFIMFLMEVYKKIPISDSYPLLIIIFVSIIMYMLRRMIRKNKNANN